MATPRRRAIAGTPGRCSRGRPRRTPVALICSGTTARQVVYRGALGELARLDSLDLPMPVIAVVGEVAALAAKLRWFGPLPLRAAPRRAPATTAS
jgi:uroporphyrin-III C-methyltransferase/precorrin-2 dehydrogenase/sirohydrochlorin ferrochelatase